MTQCFLCRSLATLRQSDYGRGVIEVTCPNCGCFETHDEAVKHLVSNSFGDQRRREMQSTVKKLTEQNIAAEIVVIKENGSTQIIAQKKPNE